VWRFAGMSAIAIGLDLAAALARLPDESALPEDLRTDTHAVRELLLIGERAALDTIAKYQSEKETENGSRRE
jgi:hypothetical protein